MNFDDLQKPISSLPGIGSSYASRLKKLNIHTTNDLLHHYPFRYDDLSASVNISNIVPDEKVTLTGTMVSLKNIRLKGGKTLQKGLFADSTGQIEVAWFNQPYLEDNLKHKTISLSGKATMFRGKIGLTSPSFEIIRGHSTPTIHTGRLIPVYHETAGVSSKWLRSRIAPLIKSLDSDIDPLPDKIIKQNKLFPLKESLQQIHFPTSQETYQKALNRLKFSELFHLQIAAQIRKITWVKTSSQYQIDISPSHLHDWTQALPFTLTPDQNTAIDEILKDIRKPIPMNRLLQGDVGSGKTVVAATAMYACAKQGFSAAIMAPTEVLALQHAKTIEQLMEPHNIQVSVQSRSRKDPLDNAPIIIGTHALLHRNLPDNLGLLIIDEQHRYGVNQRSQLASLKHPPHLLSMTATPIPRTIALTLYAEVEVSTINQMPKGRQPVKTWLVNKAKRQSAYDWIDKEIDQNNSQVFIVCPLIQDSTTPKLDQVKAVESEFQTISQQVYPHRKVGLLHGRQTSKQKQAVIDDFTSHQLDILVSTPVIEVGIDIKNADIMVIEGAERFGLASLHQLRGRIGRGNRPGYCLLFPTKSDQNQRLKYLETISSGFELAELDLKLRGPGNLYGTQQSGYIDLKLASFSDTALINTTSSLAKSLVQSDLSLAKYPKLKQTIQPLLANGATPH